VRGARFIANGWTRKFCCRFVSASTFDPQPLKRLDIDGAAALVIGKQDLKQALHRRSTSRAS
jgi:hypothetical protein